MSEKPRSAADPRPDDEPFYIDSECPDCGTELELYDFCRPNDGKLRANVWYDEWACPECQDGIHLDWPDTEPSDWDEGVEYATLVHVPVELDIGLGAAENHDTSGLDEALDDIDGGNDE